MQAIADAIADGRILASPVVGAAVPHRFDGTPLQPLTTAAFNQAVPSPTGGHLLSYQSLVMISLLHFTPIH